METFEAEYVALRDASKEGLFTKAILGLLERGLNGIQVDTFYDNIDSEAIADSPSSASRSEHVKANFLFIRGKFELCTEEHRNGRAARGCPGKSLFGEEVFRC